MKSLSDTHEQTMNESRTIADYFSTESMVPAPKTISLL